VDEDHREDFTRFDSVSDKPEGLRDSCLVGQWVNGDPVEVSLNWDALEFYAFGRTRNFIPIYLNQ